MRLGREQDAVAKSASLLHTQDVVIKKPHAKSTRSVAPPQCKTSKSTVGLMLWPAKNMELVITGKYGQHIDTFL